MSPDSQRRGWAKQLFVGAIAVMVIAALVEPVMAGAQVGPTFTVTTTIDAPDAVLGNGLCATASGVCTLRAAVAEANAAPIATPATVRIPAGTFKLNNTVGVDTGDLDLTRAMTLQGVARQPGSGATTIDADLRDRALDLTAKVAVDGVVITNGKAGNGNGGGIQVGSAGGLTLTHSTVSANTAASGAGVYGGGTVSVGSSTIVGNTATKKGGGLFGAGTLNVSDSTIDSNAASGGGGIAGSGATSLKAVTITANTSNNSNGGGIYRVGGTFTITGSILAGNNATSGRDCYGSPTFTGPNIVQYTPGCNPSGDALLVTSPDLGPLGDNGGATRTRLPNSSSPAINAYAAPCTTALDQRDVARNPIPPGGRCDIGSVEIAPLGIEVDLTATPPPSAGCDPGVVCVGAGIRQVSIDKLPTTALLSTNETPSAGTPEDTFLRRTFLRRTFLRRTFLRRTDLQASDIGALTLSDLFLRRTFLRRTDSGDVSPVTQILLSDIPLSRTDGKTWEDLLANSAYQGTPLQNITLAQALEVPAVAALTLGEADVTPTSLGTLSGVLVALAPLSLSKLPLGTADSPLGGWCNLLASAFPAGCASLGIDPAVPSSADGVGLVTLALSGLDVDDLALEDIFLRRTDLSDTFLRRTFLRRTDLSASAIGDVFLRRTGAVDPVIDKIIDCSKVSCTSGTVTLKSAQAADAILAGSTVGDLLDYLATQPEWANLTLFDLMLVLTPALFPTGGLPWYEIDPTELSLQNAVTPPEPAVTFATAVLVKGGQPADLITKLTLPAGFEPVPGGSTFDGAAIADGTRVGSTLTFRTTGAGVGTHTLSVQARAGLTLGSATASVEVSATAGGQPVLASDSVSVLVKEAFELGDGSTDTRPLDTGVLDIAHLNSAYDEDLYSFFVSDAEAASGAAARIFLSNLAVDYDLVLYGPAVTPLRGTPRQRIQPVEDQNLGYDQSKATVAPDVRNDVPLSPPPDCGMANRPAACQPIAVAAQRGTTDEQIETGTLHAGTYWVEVRNYNGAFSSSPYVLQRQTVSGDPVGVCTPRTLPTASPTAGVVTLPAGVAPGGASGLILVPEGRFTRDYGQIGTEAMMSRLSQLAANTSSAVVRVDADPAVRAKYDAWDREPCSVDASNAVMRAIGQLLDGIESSNPGVANVTIVGPHNMIPFGLVPDGTTLSNERTYDPGTLPGTDNALSAAVGAGYVSTDDPYGSRNGLAVDAHELYVSELAIGRLVETPGDIGAAVQRFLDFGGQLDPSSATSAFANGYDFVADGATATADALAARGATVTRDINETWDRQDLINGLVGGDPDIAALNGHFDHNRSLPAKGNSTSDASDLNTVADVAGQASLSGALVFSIGCHSGLSVPDVELGLTDPSDWAQTFAADGASYVANTGYGYGDDESVAYSERLAQLFASQLSGGTTVGQALMAAKQAHLAELIALDPYEEKVLAQMTLYGLPMYRLGGTIGAAAPAVAPSAQVVVPAPTGPSTEPLGPISLSVSDVAGPPSPNILRPHDTGEGVYYEVDGRSTQNPRRPAQPLVVTDVSQPGRVAHGVLITGLASTELSDFRPYYVSPVVDRGAEGAELDPVGDAAFPSTLATVTNPVRADGSQGSTATLAAGQFVPRGDLPGRGDQRLFTSITGEVNYAPSGETDFTAPTIRRSLGSVVNNTVGFSVSTDASAQRVNIIFRSATSGSGLWEDVELVRTGTDLVDGSAIWTGGAVLPVGQTEIEFLVQAVDGVGNVGTSNNKVSNFLAVRPAQCGLGASLAPASALTPSGWYRTATVTTTFSTPGTEVSVDGSAFAAVPATGVAITGEGVHRLLARAGSNSCTVIVPIDTAAPTVSAQVDPAPNDRGFNSGAVTVAISAVDPGGSGASGINVQVGDGPSTLIPGDRADVPVTAKGSTVVTYSAIDAAGNSSAPGSATIRIDGVAPTVSAVVNPAPVGVWSRGALTVDISASDAETSVASITYSIGAAAAVTVGAASVSAPVSADGVTVVTYSATDAAGNASATGSVTVRIDATPPSVDITSPTAPPPTVRLGQSLTAGFACLDDGSQVASCSASVSGPAGIQAVSNGGALPTAAQGTYTLTVTATDVAGNSSSATRVYTVAYGLCLFYDPVKPQPIGGTIVLKFQLCDGSGANLSSNQIEVEAVLIDGTIAPPPNFQGNSNLGRIFRLDGATKTYIYNLDTNGLSAGGHVMTIKVGGVVGPTYQLAFTLKT